MRRNLTFDILLMSLFLIFGGTVATAQTDGTKPTNTIFGIPKPKTDGGTPEKSCLLPNDDKEYCLTSFVHFASLGFNSVRDGRGRETQEAVFPCDFYAGLTIEGLETKYVSLSDGVEYDYVAEYYGVPAHYLGRIDFGCFDYETIQNLTGEGCDGYYKLLSASLDLYCKQPSGFVALDDLTDYPERFNQVFYGEEETETQDETMTQDPDVIPDVNESGEDHDTGYSIGWKICCDDSSPYGTGPNDDGTLGATPAGSIDGIDDKPIISNIGTSNEMFKDPIQVEVNNIGVRIVGAQGIKINYTVFDLNGVKQLSGVLDSNHGKSNVLFDSKLANGMYILVLRGQDYQSSHKFVSFR